MMETATAVNSETAHKKETLLTNGKKDDSASAEAPVITENGALCNGTDKNTNELRAKSDTISKVSSNSASDAKTGNEINKMASQDSKNDSLNTASKDDSMSEKENNKRHSLNGDSFEKAKEKSRSPSEYESKSKPSDGESKQKSSDESANDCVDQTKNEDCDNTSDCDTKTKEGNQELQGKKQSPSAEKDNRKAQSEKDKDKKKSEVEEMDTNEIDSDKEDDDSDSSNNKDADDIEIIGESKVVSISNASQPYSSSNVVFVPASLSTSNSGFSTMSQGFAANSYLANSNIATTAQGFMAGMPNLSQSGAMSQGVSLLTPSVAPPKPKSSLDQIELIRWEIQNRVNTRPKYFKPNPSSELGPLAKFLFDIGSDLIKESVYHDLVKIQSKKNDDDKLSDKEREDLEKLKEIEKDLYATIGHLKIRLRKRCNSCNFQTESNNVLFFHKQFPHEDNKNLRCSHCSYHSKQAVHYKFHMESEHAIQPRLHDKKAFYECDLCPYENNQEQKLVLHKQRCIKQFRPLFNLHPSCLSGAEINLCLENIFYKPMVPKNLKILQQKHAQQQAALAEARRQQAQMQALAAQKNAAALAAKKQQQIKRQLPVIAPRYNVPNQSSRMSFPTMPGQSPVRYNSNQNAKNARPTVANMLNSKQGSNLIPTGTSSQNNAAGSFEVCEICGGFVKDRKALRIHFFYAHRIDLPFNLFERTQAPLYCATCYVRFWTAQGLRKHIDTHKEENQTRGVVGKCISCGHHVLNLLLHMRIVHNREMQHYINALMCMFCGSHFGSRQECERHVLKSHGSVDPVTGTLKSSPTQPPQPPMPKGPSGQKKSSSSNSMVKGSVCVLCNLNFGRNVDLTRHCMRMHHTCMKCGMVVIDKASLMKHTCLSSPSGTRDCSMCGETGFHPAYYVKHLRDKHLKKFNIKVSKLSISTVERWTKQPYPFKQQEEILVEISDSDEDAPLKGLKSPMASSTPRPGVKHKMGPACKTRRAPEPSPAPIRKKPRMGPASKIGRRPISQVVSSKDDDGDENQQRRKVTDEGVIEIGDSTRDVDSDDDGDASLKGQKRKASPCSPGSDKGEKRKKSSP